MKNSIINGSPSGGLFVSLCNLQNRNRPFAKVVKFWCIDKIFGAGVKRYPCFMAIFVFEAFSFSFSSEYKDNLSTAVARKSPPPRGFKAQKTTITERITRYPLMVVILARLEKGKS